MKRLALTGFFFALSVSALAHGSSYPQTGSDSGSIMDAVAVPRAVIWIDYRVATQGDGTILVCPAEAAADRDGLCFTEQGKVKINMWTPLQRYVVPGMVLKSYEFRYRGSGGTAVLIAYYGPVVTVPKAETSAPAFNPSTLNFQGKKQ